MTGLRMRERGREQGESDRFTLFLIKDQDVVISGEGVKVKSEKTNLGKLQGKKPVVRHLQARSRPEK